MNWLAVGVGAALGAWLRWGMSVWMSGMHARLAIATLAVNWIGSYLIGVAIAFFSSHPGLAPAWRLFVITGFLGGLTTFSTFSGEAMAYLQRGEYGWAFGHSALHLLGSIGCCILGVASWRAVAA
ncbi:fluoride efflux transporter CrcB [Janthinobacterium fluminis]|uniref:Fluoride-specific ion channel FluC n=1 Tax=Janthinobacterium fluminis TaxID=2987524 RepID=A0ABT5K2H9_9BURK|nr:fluoride efflux transporter CrcB [Janthinobacterium fluminis]MDC8758471.1 fluoride efflux transporter CrcB [Janthinobacterium fluminis]